MKERLYDNPFVVTAILTFVLVGAEERIKSMETVEKRGVRWLLKFVVKLTLK